MQIFHYEEIDSTNLEAKRLITMGQINGKALITTKKQTNGRGRLERQWQFQEGNLAFSCVFPKLWVKEVPVPLAVCIGVLNSLSKTENVFFKWTNDLLILENEIPKKFGGILVEQEKDFIIAGIGINKESFPHENTNFPATSLKNHQIEILSEERILQNILPVLNFSKQSAVWHWNEKSFFTGKWVKINEIQGVFQGVDENFNAILKTKNGNETVFFGDMAPI